jgi:hypothetical protein
MSQFKTIFITFFALLGLIIAVPMDSSIVEHSLFRRGDPTVDCWRPDNTKPCIWLRTERSEYTSIHPQSPVTIEYGGNIYAKTYQITKTIGVNGKQYAWIDFKCLGQRYEKKTRSGATLRFEDGKTMKNS